jgi:uncharacterized protein (TIGR00251 family)
VLLRVRITPRARRNSLEGERAGVLLVRVTAPPVDGAANEALMKVLGKVLGLPPSAIRITKGVTGRDKTVVLLGADVSSVRARLEPVEEDVR